MVRSALFSLLLGTALVGPLIVAPVMAQTDSQPVTGQPTVEPTADHPLWAGLAAGSHFYFVHSYHVVAGDSALVAAQTPYGALFTSAAVQDNIVAVQFHPEKSAANGLKLLENFVGWQP